MEAGMRIRIAMKVLKNKAMGSKMREVIVNTEMIEIISIEMVSIIKIILPNKVMTNNYNSNQKGKKVGLKLLSTSSKQK